MPGARSIMMSAINSIAAKPVSHVKCRAVMYPRDNVSRFPVAEDKVSWSTEYTEYNPSDHTSPSVLAKPVWADPDFREASASSPQWNEVDGKINRKSHMGSYDIANKVPRNPVGRTGVCGRGCLGRWGPNHAADPIVTRWKRDGRGHQVKERLTGKPILQFVAILRRDSGEWAIPGGMVDAGEAVSVTLKREFGEEAMNSLEAPPDEKEEIEEAIHDLFHRGKEVYRGYVDDPRNTDNAWMETMAYNFHDETGRSVGRFALHAGDDAVGVRWTDISSALKLFASHELFVKETAHLHNAHW